MAVVRIPDEGRTIKDEGEVRAVLAGVGIEYERWQPAHPVPDGAPAEEVLTAYASEIERLKKAGGYVTADVGALLIIVSIVLSILGLRRLRRGTGTRFGRAVGVISILLLAAYLVAVWAMTAKPT